MIQMIGAFIGIVATGIMVEAPKRTLITAGTIGGIGWYLYLALHIRYGEVMSIYLCSLFIAFMCQVFARILKTPVTTLIIPGFYPLVPGVALYRCVYYLIMYNMELFKKFFDLTLLTAGMIALAIFTVDSVFSIFIKIKNYQKK